jgi:membrane-bound ClpP family serine protease
MRRHNKLYKKWKNVPRQPRQILAFLLGVSLIIISPLVGTVPGPGGIAVFVLGTAVLASEFDWLKV